MLSQVRQPIRQDLVSSYYRRLGRRRRTCAHPSPQCCARSCARCCWLCAGPLCCMYTLLWLYLWRGAGIITPSSPAALGRMTNLDRVNQIECHLRHPLVNGTLGRRQHQTCGFSLAHSGTVSAAACKCADSEGKDLAPHPQRGFLLHRDLRCVPQKTGGGAADKCVPPGTVEYDAAWTDSSLPGPVLDAMINVQMRSPRKEFHCAARYKPLKPASRCSLAKNIKCGSTLNLSRSNYEHACNSLKECKAVGVGSTRYCLKGEVPRHGADAPDTGKGVPSTTFPIITRWFLIKIA